MKTSILPLIFLKASNFQGPFQMAYFDNSFHFLTFILRILFTFWHSPWQFIHNCLLSIGNGNLQGSLKMMITSMICDSNWNRWKSNESVGQSIFLQGGVRVKIRRPGKKACASTHIQIQQKSVNLHCEIELPLLYYYTKSNNFKKFFFF